MAWLRIPLRIAGGYEVCGGLGSAGVACAVIAMFAEPYVWIAVASGLIGAAIGIAGDSSHPDSKAAAAAKDRAGVAKFSASLGTRQTARSNECFPPPYPAAETVLRRVGATSLLRHT